MKNGTIFLQLLLCGSIISGFNLTENDPRDEPLADELHPKIIPKQYDISVKNIEPDIFYGEVIIMLRFFEDRKEIEFQVKRLSVVNITIQGLQNHERQFLVYQPLTYIYSIEPGIVKVNFIKPILPGLYLLTMKFIGRRTLIKDNNNNKYFTLTFGYCYINNGGIVTWHELTNYHWLTIETLEYIPIFKTLTLDTNVMIYLKLYEEFEDIPYETVTFIIENGVIRTYFERNSTRLIAVIMGGLENFSMDYEYLGIRMWYRQQKEESLRYAWNVIKFFTLQLLNLISPIYNEIFVKNKLVLNHIAHPWYQENEIESSCGLILYKEEDIIENRLQYIERIKMEQKIARKMIQNNFHGDLHWFNERLFDYITALIVDKNPNTSQVLDMFVVQNRYDSLTLDYVFSAFTLTELSEFENSTFKISPFHLRAYVRVPSLLRMLEYAITTKVFMNGIVQFIKKNFPVLPLNHDYFWNSMQIAYDEIRDKNNIHITSTMNTVMYQTLHPILNVTQQTGDWVAVFIENKHIDNYILPITYTTQSKLNFTISFNDIIWLNRTNIFLHKYIKDVDSDDWVIFNIQQTGYYRVSYEEQNWRKIANYLNSGEYKLIPELNRAQLIDDAFHFVITKRINSSIFWKLTTYLSQETSFVVWYPMLKALEYMSSVFQLPDKKVENVKRKIVLLLDAVLREIGYQEKYEHNFIASLRQEVAKWACILGSSDCRKAAADILQKHIGPEKYKIMPWWEKWVYCNGIDSETLGGNLVLIEAKTIQKFFVCLRHPDKFLSDMKPLIEDKKEDYERNDKHYINTLFSIVRHAKERKVLNYILETFDKFTEKINRIALLIYIINHINSAGQLDQVYFFVIEKHEVLSMYVERKIVLRLIEITSQIDLYKIYKFSIPLKIK